MVFFKMDDKSSTKKITAARATIAHPNKRRM